MFRETSGPSYSVRLELMIGFCYRRLRQRHIRLPSGCAMPVDRKAPGEAIETFGCFLRSSS